MLYFLCLFKGAKSEYQSETCVVKVTAGFRTLTSRISWVLEFSSDRRDTVNTHLARNSCEFLLHSTLPRQEWQVFCITVRSPRPWRSAGSLSCRRPAKAEYQMTRSAESNGCRWERHWFRATRHQKEKEGAAKWLRRSRDSGLLEKLKEQRTCVLQCDIEAWVSAGSQSKTFKSNKMWR